MYPHTHTHIMPPPLPLLLPVCSLKHNNIQNNILNSLSAQEKHLAPLWSPRGLWSGKNSNHNLHLDVAFRFVNGWHINVHHDIWHPQRQWELGRADGCLKSAVRSLGWLWGRALHVKHPGSPPVPWVFWKTAGEYTLTAARRGWSTICLFSKSRDAVGKCLQSPKAQPRPSCLKGEQSRRGVRSTSSLNDGERTLKR